MHAHDLTVYGVYIVCICMVIYLFIVCLKDVILYVALVVNYFHNLLKTKPFREMLRVDCNKGSNMIVFS